MKLVIIGLSSLLTVGGTTAISQNASSQRPTKQFNMPTMPQHIRDLQNRGVECQSVDNPIFGTVALPLEVENMNCSLWQDIPVDLDGDGTFEDTYSFYSISDSCYDNYVWSQPATKIRYVEGSNPPAVISETFLNLNPDIIQYEGVDFPGDFYISLEAYLDVTNDGKPDAIIRADWSEVACDYEISVFSYFYIENISQWGGVCATDINNDGSTNVNDLLAVVGNWGPCE
jgi:hypothetical protein